MPGWFSPYPRGSVAKLLARLYGMQEVSAWLLPCLHQQRRNHTIIKVALSGFFYVRTVFRHTPRGRVAKLLARLHGMQEVSVWLPPCLHQQRRNHMIIKVALSGLFMFGLFSPDPRG